MEDAELVTEGENLGAEMGVGVTADDQDLEEKTDDGAGEGAEHDKPTSRRCPSRGGAGRREVTDRVDAQDEGLRPQASSVRERETRFDNDVDNG